MKLRWTAIFLVGLSASAMARETFPQPPKPKTQSPYHVSPGIAIPPDAESVTWVVYDPDKVHTSVPLTYLDEDGSEKDAGTLPVGTTVKLERFRPWHGWLYYGVPAPSAKATGAETWAWLNGRYIQPAK